ncbi:MAG: DUF2934 domain-containing protein [Deltaproteobacteria bacterium]|nr:DUF2934 domain-containing protein [Deltaproteobacteria bacterium]
MEKNTPAQLEERAYHIWERAGRPHGRALEHWLQAQTEVNVDAPAEKPKRRTRKAASSKAKTTRGKTGTARAKAASAKAEPAKAKPKKVAKSDSATRKAGTRRKRTAPRA